MRRFGEGRRLAALATMLLTLLSCAGCPRHPWFAGGYHFDRTGETAARTADAEVPPDVQRIEVENQFGRVQVEVAEDRPSWSWEVTCWAATAEVAERFATEVDLRVKQEGGGASWSLILPAPPVPELRGVRSDLTLAVPASVQVTVNNRFGDTLIHGVEGQTRVRSEHGDVELRDLQGRLDATTSFGLLDARGIRTANITNRHGSVTVREADGNLVILDKHGDVTVDGLRGTLKVENEHGDVAARRITENAEIRTSFGSIELEEAQGEAILRNEHGQISARNVQGRLEVTNEHGKIDLEVDSAEVACRNENGAIRLNLRNPELRSVRAETSFRDLQVCVVESLSPAVEAQTSFGKVRSDVPVFTIEAGRDNFEGLDADVPRMTLRNKHGDISVKKSVEPARAE